MIALWRFLKIYKTLRRPLTLGIALSSVSLIANVYLLSLSGWFLAAMGLAGLTDLTFNYFTPAAMIRGLSILRTTGRYAERLVTHDATLRATSAFRSWFFARLVHVPGIVLQRLESATLFTRLRLDIDQLERFCIMGLLPLTATGFVLIILFGLSALLSNSLFCLLLSYVVIALLMIVWTQYRLSPSHSAIAHQHDQIYLLLGDTLRAREGILVHGAMTHKMATCAEMMITLETERRRLFTTQSVLQAVLAGGAGFLLVASLWFIVPLLQAQGTGTGTASIAALPLLCFALYELTQIFPGALQSVFQAIMSAKRVFTIVDQSIKPKQKIRSVSRDRFELELSNVSFGYTNRLFIKNFNLKIKSGDKVAICGPSGSGKSTLIDIITGYLKPRSGNWTLNNVPLNMMDSHGAQDCFAIVPQKPYIFAETFLYNLTLGHPNATLEQINSACDIAGLSDVLSTWPDGLRTMLGEQGQRLSGGEIRRLAIARALLKPASCLILDEPSEGLDREMEQAVMRRVIQSATDRHQALILCVHHADNLGTHGFQIRTLD